MSIPQKSLKNVTLHDSSKAYNGYTLFAPMGQKDVWLVDMQGQFVHHWKTPHVIGQMGVLLPNGNLLCGGRIPGIEIEDLPGSGGELLELDWDSNIVWEYKDLYINNHDWYRMENGNTMICHWAPMPNDLADRVNGGIPGSERNGIMWGDVLQEINLDGKVVWEYPVYEHMDPEVDVLCPLCPRETWTYINSVVVLPDENILVSIRLINTLAIIDKKIGEITWRWGREELGHQHNATMLDNGNVLVFDNGLHSQLSSVSLAGYSRVLEINPETNKIEWEYTDENISNFHSAVCSGAQRLPNGNTLICESTTGRIFEVTAEKEIVWEFISPFYGNYIRGGFGWTNLVYRAHRYGPDYEGLKGRCLDPDKFEWVLQEKRKLGEEEEKVRARLAAMGY